MLFRLPYCTIIYRYTAPLAFDYQVHVSIIWPLLEDPCAVIVNAVQCMVLA